MALRDGRGAGLGRAARGRPGVVGLVCALYLGAGLLAMAPQLGSFGSHFLARGTPVPGEAAAGDHLQAEYHLWLVGHQLSSFASPLRDPYTFQPESPPRWNFGGWPFGLPFWPLDAIFGHVVGWNLFLLLTYLAAGAFTYLWLRSLGLPRGAALAGGLVFALMPYRVAQSAGHLRGPVSALLPLALWAFERSRHEWGWWLAGAAAALASIPFSDVHLALGAVPFFLLYALCRGGRLDAVAATLPTVGTALVVGHFSTTGIGAGGRSLREVSRYSASGLDFLTRHPRHGLESFVFLGWLTPLVALAGLVLLLRARRYALAIALGIGALVPIVLAFGTHFPLYEPLWHHFPPLRYPRVPERQLPVACLALAALVAFALAEVRWRVTLVVAIALLAADLRVDIYEAAAVGPGKRAYAPLRAAPDKRLLELPVFDPSVHLGSLYLYYDQEAQLERPGGYSTIAPKEAARLALRLQGLNCGEWRAGTNELLRSMSVDFIAFHRGLTGRLGWFAWHGLSEHRFGPVGSDGAVTMFARNAGVAPSPVPEPRGRIVFCQNWNDGKPRSSHAALWARGRRLQALLASREPVTVTFNSDGRLARSLRLNGPARVGVPLGPGGWHLVTVDADRPGTGLQLERVSAR